jgi:hypothetical protein
MGMKQFRGEIPWLIDRASAADLDSKTQKVLDELSESAESSPYRPFDAGTFPRLFKLSNFVELSDRVFMHGSKKRPYEDWSFMAEAGETPSLTSQALEDLYDIMSNLLRRMMQTSMFLAESRIQATSTKGSPTSRDVTVDDVEGMCQVLNVARDSWGFWTTLPRKADLRVVSGDHRRGFSARSGLSYDAVESALAVRHHQGRLRSASVGSSASYSSVSGSEKSSDSQTPPPRVSRDGYAEYDEAPPAHISQQDPIAQFEDRSNQPWEADMEVEIEVAYDSYLEDESLSDQAESGHETDEEEDRRSEQPKSSSQRQTKRKRRRAEEEAVEIYLQDLDVYERVKEEHRLTALLGIGNPSGPLEQYADLGRRPKVRRKMTDDSRDVQPRAEWEWNTVKGRLLSVVEDEDQDIPVQSVEQPDDDVQSDD